MEMETPKAKIVLPASHTLGTNETRLKKTNKTRLLVQPATLLD